MLCTNYNKINVSYANNIKINTLLSDNIIKIYYTSIL